MTPEAAVTKAIESYLSVLVQQGRFFYCRTNVAKGMLLSHGHYAQGIKYLEAGEPQKALRELRWAHAISTGRTGWPDLTGIWRREDGTGQFVGIEVKAGTSQSWEQREVQNTVEGLGGLYILAHNVRDVEAALGKRRALLGKRRALPGAVDVSDVPF
jgi:hypothetical protein